MRCTSRRPGRYGGRQDAISAIRARRAEMNVPPSRKAQVILVTAQPENYQLGAHFITRMAYASELTVLTAAPADLTGMVTVATHDATVYMPMAELVDIARSWSASPPSAKAERTSSASGQAGQQVLHLSCPGERGQRRARKGRKGPGAYRQAGRLRCSNEAVKL